MYAVRLLWGLMGRNYNQFQLDAKIEFNCHVIKDLIESISRHNSLAFFFFGTFCYIFKSVWHIFIHFVFLYEFWTYETLLFFRQVCDSQGNLMMPDDASGADNFLDFVIYWCFLKIFSSGLRKIVFAFTIARFDYGPHAFPRIPSWPHFRCVFSHSFIYIYLFYFFKLPNLESRTSSTSARYSPQKNSEL